MHNTDDGVVVLLFGGHRPPRALAALAAVAVADPAGIDAAIGSARRVAVVGGDADLAAVLTRLLRTERLDVEVAPVRGRREARRVLHGTAQRVPLIRDDTATALVGAALWLPPAGSAELCGEAVVDDAALFDGTVAGVRIEPTGVLPGLRARPIGIRRGWLAGRAVQLGTTGVRVVRDGVPAARELKRSTFYRHTTGWLRVG